MMKTLYVSSNIKRLKNGAGPFALLAFAALAQACVPQDLSIATPGPSPSPLPPAYEGFTGVVTAETVGATKVKLSWNASSDPTVAAYNIYDTTLVFSPRLVKTVPAPANFATVTSLANQTLYSFRVRAADSKGKEDSNAKDLTAIPYAGILSSSVLSSTAATVTFSDGSNADSISIYCKTNSDPTWVLVRGLTNVNLTQATLSGLTPGETYTCRTALVIGTLTDNNSTTITFTPIGQATQMVFSTQPGSAGAGAALPPQPVVTIMDANNNIVSAGPDSTAVITLNLASNSPTQGTIRGTASMAAVRGVATFTGLNFQETGIKILTASKADTSSQTFGTAPFTADSSQFTISAGPVSASTSTIAVSPAGAQVADGNHPFTVTITLKDQYGNSIVGVRPAFTSSSTSTPAKDVSSDSITQPTTNTNSSGVATGSLAATVSGPRAVTVSSPAGLSAVTTNASFVAGTATKLAFQSGFGPANSPAGAGLLNTLKVEVQDSYGNLVNTGTAASSAVSINISTNPSGGNLTGTNVLGASNGVAQFDGLGIDKTGTGFKLIASSGSLIPVYSSSFNVTAGVPTKIGLTAPASVLSGGCSTAITVQLQDGGGNPANALATTPVSVSGLSGAQLFTSAACTGTANGATISFTTGSNTKTFYLKDNKAESVALTLTDPAQVMSSATKTINALPVQVALAGPASVVAGKCSAALIITTAGNDGNPGNVATNTTLSISGLGGTQAALYTASDCSGSPLTPSSITAAGNTAQTMIYLKDNKAEALSVNVADPAATMATTSGALAINVLASNIDLAGPTTVVSGTCANSPAFVIKLKDALGNTVAATADTTLTIVGLDGTHGAFYTSSSCGGSAIGSSITFPSGATQLSLYFSDNWAEAINLSVSDPAAKLTTSNVIALKVSPSSFDLSGPTNVATSVCSSVFTLTTRDGGNNVSGAVTPITANLGGAGVGGSFYSDSSCTSAITSLVFSAGQSTKSFYFKGLNPAVATPLTLTATDAGAILAAASANISVSPAAAWIGTIPNFNWFQTGKVPVMPRENGAGTSWSIQFSSNHNYMYVSDRAGQRVLKYDYTNQTYIGWIGAFNNTGPAMTGSVINSTLNAACASTSADYTQTPGWCQGAQARADSNTAAGHMYDPMGIAEDGTYLYVTQFNGGTVTRYNAATGAYAGYIGKVNTTPSAPGTGLTNTCTSTTSGNITPGWCIGGASTGLFYGPMAIVYNGGFLYVGDQSGAIRKFEASTGQYLGWIGWATSQPTGVGIGSSNGCASMTGLPKGTPGWCLGGGFVAINPNGNSGGLGYVKGLTVVTIPGTTPRDVLLASQHDNSGTISAYDLNSGAFIGIVATGSSNFSNPYQMWTDGFQTVAGDEVNGTLYIADTNRLMQLNVDITGTSGALSSWGFSSTVFGWVGKVNTTPSGGGSACTSTTANNNTPGWCLGGTPKNGLNEGALHATTALAYDGAGNLISGQGGNDYAQIKRWTLSTGIYTGTMGFNNSNNQWSADSLAYASAEGYDDNSFYSPAASYVNGTDLYVAEYQGSRVKKIDTRTGTTTGWIGGIISSPTGGAAGCAGAGFMAASPGWCLGSFSQPQFLWNSMIAQLADGIMLRPRGITGDGTYLYVSDNSLHRIQRYLLSDGSYGGWIGGIGGTAPTAATCTGTINGPSTSGWCKGGSWAGGSGDGYMNSPVGLTYLAPYIYVIDDGNDRISRFNASSGTFDGWMGEVNSTTGLAAGTGTTNTACASTTTGNPTPGWCKGGTSRSTTANANGTFQFNAATGITNDGTNLYVGDNFGRIQKLKASGNGSLFLAAVATRTDRTTDVFSTTATTNGNVPHGIWTDGTNIYYDTDGRMIVKRKLSDGSFIGLQGALGGAAPTGGPTGCVGAVGITPDWCVTTANSIGFTLKKFSGAGFHITGDTNFVYISDETSNRVTRIPK